MMRFSLFWTRFWLILGLRLHPMIVDGVVGFVLDFVGLVLDGVGGVVHDSLAHFLGLAVEIKFRGQISRLTCTFKCMIWPKLSSKITNLTILKNNFVQLRACTKPVARATYSDTTPMRLPCTVGEKNTETTAAINASILEDIMFLYFVFTHSRQTWWLDII